MTEVATGSSRQGVKTLTAALAAPFDAREVKFKPQMVKGNRALALAYVDCRVIQDRLDEVLGVEGWQDEYELLPDGSVACKLQLALGDRWVTKMDVGSPSEQPDGGDRLKAAFSDALKRAAVKFGVGRYLYRLQAQWADYDPVKKQFTQTPQLPTNTRPKVQGNSLPKVENGDASMTPAPKRNSTPSGTKMLPAAVLPMNGEELHRRLRDYDAKLSSQKLCGVGALLTYVVQAGLKAGYGDDIAGWGGPAIPFAVDVVKQFEAQLRPAKNESHHTAA
ncbi:putative DNA-binding protein Erf [Fimbriiglobus ruber]|uniref:Putative DNA-binding protein Erf n=2 Tax=Fimbriiglobus ruber TaxID=1908690 RepID=A0A225E6U7_9BACT|nr:putative DNA-binding protein Erf [Fimbriiglobus ruber]